MSHYNVSSIVEMSQLDHLRKNSGMYIGDSETPTRLLEELLDNSLDEVLHGDCNVIGVFIDTKTNTFRVLDNGRGFPFDQSLPLEQDPPVLSATKLFTSGKFNKGEKDSAYGVAAGLHGIGLVACFALSEWMNIDIYKSGKHGTYEFKHNGDIDRKEEKYKKSEKTPYSTRIEVKPSTKYFSTNKINVQEIEERLNIAVSNFPNLKIIFRIDEENRIIKGDLKELILDKLSPDIDWINFNDKKESETYHIELGWSEQPPNSLKVYTTVNLCRVLEGTHILKITNTIKKYFQDYIGKSNKDNTIKYNFQPNDCLVGMRLYIDLKIIKASFAEQIKKKLSSQSDLSILDNFEKNLENYFKKNTDELHGLLETFHNYRSSMQNKKLLGTATSGNKRGLTTLTKLRDCTKPGGELLIGEGDSAIGNLIKVRDPKKHAILPLRGVVPNAITKKDLHENKELKDIIIACGCGVDNNCDINKLRYDKIILAADADPAGKWITALLITLFAYKMPEVIKTGHLYVCVTPLFGYKEKKTLIPLWNIEEVEEKRKENKKILRFKGLGEFNAEDLKVFTLDEKTRNLIKVEWSNNYSENLFKLMSDSGEKRKLILGEWKLEG